MGNLNIDLTGEHPNYRIEGKIYKGHRFNQLVDFQCTVFEDSVEVYLISSGLPNTRLTKDVDYIIPDTFRDSTDNDTSSAKIADPAFRATLISGIQLIRGIDAGVEYIISVNYQRLFPKGLITPYFYGEPLDITPEVMTWIVATLQEHELLLSRVTDHTSLVSDSLLLEVDESKTNPNNFIEKEVHTLNVPGGRFLIHPKAGAFYADSVEVYHPASNTKLVQGTDYVIVGMDEARTKATCHTSPVYGFIMVKTAITDEVQVTYHAFGGEPTIDNYRELLEDLKNITFYLNDSQTLTTSTLGSTKLIVDMLTNDRKMEDRMRRLEGTPAYGDITTGKSILMKLFSEAPGMHWYTIASLYQIAGVVTPCTADTFIFRLQSKISHFQFQVAVSVDLSNESGERFSVSLISDNYPRGFIPFDDYSKIDRIIRPQLRVVWTEGDNISGAYLQLGFELNNMLEETIQIEDMSGHESCWKLVDEISGVTLPSDKDFLLPDKTSIWSDLNPSCQQESQLVPFRKGHLIWAGMKTLNRPDAGWSHFTISNNDELLLTDVNISKLTKLRLNIEEVGGLKFPVDIHFNPGLPHLKGHATFTHQEKPAYVNADIYIEDEAIKLRLNYEITAGVDSNMLHLRDMIIYS